MKKIYLLILVLVSSAAVVDAQKLIRENFNSGVSPSTWTVDNLFEVGDVGVLGSTYFSPDEHGIFIAYNDDAATGTAAPVDVSIVTSSFDLSTATSAKLYFDLYYFDALYAGAQEVANVEVSTDGMNWTEIAVLAGDTDGWQSMEIDMIDYLGNASVWLRFNYSDGGGWSYGIALDDILVLNPLTNDIFLGGLVTKRFVKETDFSSIPVTNYGTDPVTSIDVTWGDGTTSYTETFDGLNLGFLESTMLDMTTNFAAFGAKEVALSASAEITGVMDLDMEDNSTLSPTVISIVEEDFTKRMLAEEGTGTWCPWCPRGTVFIDQMVADFPDNFVGVAVHNADPMVVDAHDTGLGLIIGGYPSVSVDRAYETDPSTLPDELAARMDDASPVNIDATATYVTDAATIEVSMTSNFYTEVTDRQFTFSAIVVEDGLTGTGSDWAQANAYAGGGNGVMGGYENLANPVPAADMVYDHVSRALIGGWNGMVGNFPATVENGTEITHTMMIDVDSSWNTENLHIVVLVADNATGNIHNAMNVEIGGIFSPTNNVVELENFNLYPNPAQEVTQLTFDLEEKKDVNVAIYNNMGQNVWSNAYGEMVGSQNFNVDLKGLNTGAYTLVIQLDGTEFIAKQLQIVE